MSTGYSKTRHEASDRYLEQVKQIVGPLLLLKAPLVADLREATDLVSDNKRVNVRIRTPGYFDQYPDDFTFRHPIDPNVESELSKVAKGYGDWMLYAHQLTHVPEDGFRNWRLLNLNAVRVHYCQNKDPRIHTHLAPNKDKHTKLQVFHCLEFPDEDPKLLIAEGPQCPVCESVLKQEIGASFIHSWCAMRVGHFDSWRALNGGKLLNSGAPLFQKL